MADSYPESKFARGYDTLNELFSYCRDIKEFSHLRGCTNEFLKSFANEKVSTDKYRENIKAEIFRLSLNRPLGDNFDVSLFTDETPNKPGIIQYPNGAILYYGDAKRPGKFYLPIGEIYRVLLKLEDEEVYYLSKRFLVGLYLFLYSFADKETRGGIRDNIQLINENFTFESLPKNLLDLKSPSIEKLMESVKGLDPDKLLGLLPTLKGLF